MVSFAVARNEKFMTYEKVREIRLRRWATRLGLFLHKSRARRWSINNNQGYAVTDPDQNMIVYGQKYELDLDQVEEFLNKYEANLRSL
jgi:hypothetical protein